MNQTKESKAANSNPHLNHREPHSAEERLKTIATEPNREPLHDHSAEEKEKKRLAKDLETDLWLDYLIDLDPDDETGAFLTPGDLNAVDHAYLRLQTNDAGGIDDASGRKKLAGNADDKFIKRKMALALQRAIPPNLESIPEEKINHNPRAIEKIDSDLAFHPPAAEPEHRFRILNYQKGYVSGQCKVMFPKSKPKRRNFQKEMGWKATVEIVRCGKSEKRTIFARGLCMNVLYSEFVEDICSHFISDSKLDNSGICFEPVSMGHDNYKSDSHDHSLNFFGDSEWKTVEPQKARKFLWTKRLGAISHPFAFLFCLATRSYNFLKHQ